MQKQSQKDISIGYCYVLVQVMPLRFGVGPVCGGASSERVGPVTGTLLDDGGKRPV